MGHYTVKFSEVPLKNSWSRSWNATRISNFESIRWGSFVKYLLLPSGQNCRKSSL